jgi:hypothetical protein
VIPFSTAERKLIGAEILGLVNLVLVSARDASVTTQAEQEIRALLRARHRIPAAQKEEDFNLRRLQEIADASAGASQVMTILLASVASIALLVGGIGIMKHLVSFCHQSGRGKLVCAWRSGRRPGIFLCSS